MAPQTIEKKGFHQGFFFSTMEETLLLGSGRADPIRLRNLGWGYQRFDRPSFLVSLESEALVGPIVPQGPRIYDRV